MRRLLLFLLLCLPATAWADVAFDAWSNSAAEFTDDAGGTWTHTPVGTPRAVICLAVRSAGITDTIVGITYGGAAMTEMTGSPIIHDQADDDHVVHGFFLGSSIASGAQTVIVDVNAAVAHRAGCTTLTASADTELVDVDATVNADAQTDPSVTLSLGGRTSFAMLVAGSGQAQITGIAPLTNWNGRLEHDFGAVTAGFYTYDIIGTTDVTAGWTQTSENAAMIAVAVSEVVAAVTRSCILGDGDIC